MNISAHASMIHRFARLHLDSASQSSTGFTLIELLVAIAVLSILAAVGLPQLNGIYENQKLTNAANELVTTIKSLQNQALANNQDRFTIPEPNGPITDCSPVSENNQPYVDGYKLTVDAGGEKYVTSFMLRSHNKAGESCPTAPAVSNKISSVSLPGGVQFGGGEGNKSILYCVVTGRVVFDGGDCDDTTKSAEELTLSNQRLPATAHTYHICINQGRVYAQTSACPPAS